MNKMFFAALLLAVMFSASSCALMFNGTTQRVTVKSMTPDSKIYIDGEYAGTDEASQKLKRKDNHAVMVKKPNCRTASVSIDPEVQVGWIIFDAVFNWFAFLTDAPTGAWNSFDKKNVTVELECNENNASN